MQKLHNLHLRSQEAQTFFLGSTDIFVNEPPDLLMEYSNAIEKVCIVPQTQESEVLLGLMREIDHREYRHLNGWLYEQKTKHLRPMHVWLPTISVTNFTLRYLYDQWNVPFEIIMRIFKTICRGIMLPPLKPPQREVIAFENCILDFTSGQSYEYEGSIPQELVAWHYIDMPYKGNDVSSFYAMVRPVMPLGSISVLFAFIGRLLFPLHTYEKWNVQPIIYGKLPIMKSILQFYPREDVSLNFGSKGELGKSLFHISHWKFHEEQDLQQIPGLWLLSTPTTQRRTCPVFVFQCNEGKVLEEAKSDEFAGFMCKCAQFYRFLAKEHPNDLTLETLLHHPHGKDNVHYFKQGQRVAFI